MAGLKTIGRSANKNKNIGSPIVIKTFSSDTTAEKHSSIEKFLNSISAEEQLGLLKSIIEVQKDSINDEVIQFLAIVYYEAPAKHPIKCFLSRHITKCPAMQKPFTNFLTAHIHSDIKRYRDEYEYKYYSEIIPKVLMCIENFPCGALAVEGVDVDILTRYLFFDYFFMCRGKLRESTLSPTKKNEMFNLEHTMLRLIVHVIQKLQEENAHEHDLGDIPESILKCINILINDEEVPMDTKSLSGILLLSAENLRSNSTDAWKHLLQTSRTYSKCTETSNNDTLSPVLRHKIGRLAVYSAIATTIPMDLLQEDLLQTHSPAVLVLLDELLSYADGNTAEPAVTVSVSRALLQLSRQLVSVPGDAAGGRVVSALLPFVWTHLDFHLDSVRHLANQILAACIDYCADLDKRGVCEPLESLLQSVRALGEARSFYWAVCRAVPALGAPRVLADLCKISALLNAAATPHLQAAACAAITALLTGGACAGLETYKIFNHWVRPALQSPLVMQAVLPGAIDAHPALAEHLLSCVDGSEALACVRASPACRALLTQRALRAAAIHAQDETRILALSLVAESGRTTASLTSEELEFVLWFLQYNLHAPRPGFRTALLANMSKLLKRLEDSYHSLSRRGQPPEYYSCFIKELRMLCFAAALPGASHGRRTTALQLLASTEPILPVVEKVWKERYVETLLRHLDDSYDANKAHALNVLQHCPIQLLENCSRDITLSSVLAGAVSLRAADGAAAAAKLQLLLTRLPHRITPAPTDVHLVSEKVRPQYALLHALLQQLCRVAQLDTWQEAARGGAAGTLRCIADVLRQHASVLDWRHPPWSELGAQLIEQCIAACVRAEPIVAHHAPEGYLPDLPTSAIESESGVSVTAQMVLVCAWRAVKEAAAVLGLLAPAQDAATCLRAGQYLVQLLMKSMHRGAVDQAAVGLAALAHACWSDDARAQLPRAWVLDLLALVRRGAPHATRRGAGLPAAIQALVSSEVSATGRAECFNECMSELLRLASTDMGDTAEDGVARRTLAANILRALYRHSALEKVSQTHVAAGLRLALQGFEAATWPERTAMSLLFCALSVRIFGVTRARGPALHARNTLPAALFFQRYPGTYDLMLSKLEEFDPSTAAGPGVLPVLLLLSRLYPAAVEGAASSLKVSAFIPLVQRCACASELRIRRVAARALPALLPLSEHLSYIEKLFAAVSRPNLLHNHWHGALLTLTSLLERAVTPSGPQVTPGGPQVDLGPYVLKSMTALSQAMGSLPCYVVAKEYVNVLNMLIWKFPEAVQRPVSVTIRQHLEEVLFGAGAPGPERELCLAHCALLYFIILHKEEQDDLILPLIKRTLVHSSYEVVLSTLDYLIIMYYRYDDPEPCHLRRHLLAISDKSNVDYYSTIITIIGNIFNDNKMYQECRIKSLKLLTLQMDTQSLIINEELPTQENLYNWLAHKLIAKIEDSHDNVKHLYLESLLKMVLRKYKKLSAWCVLDVHRVIYEYSSCENSVDCRKAVLEYLEMGHFWRQDFYYLDLNPSDEFRLDAIETATLVALLEDEDDDIRQRASDIVARTCPKDYAEDPDVCLRTLYLAVRANRLELGAIASAGGELLRVRVARQQQRGAPLLLLLALLDFRAEVCLQDELTDECRVFDQSERYNIFLEESVWTSKCAYEFVQLGRKRSNYLINYALSIIHDETHSDTFQKLCNKNVKLFEKMAKGDFVTDDAVNPKVEILVKILQYSKSL